MRPVVGTARLVVIHALFVRIYWSSGVDRPMVLLIGRRSAPDGRNLARRAGAPVSRWHHRQWQQWTNIGLSVIR
jgi:hypothetical protein